MSLKHIIHADEKLTFDFKKNVCRTKVGSLISVSVRTPLFARTGLMQRGATVAIRKTKPKLA